MASSDVTFFALADLGIPTDTASYVSDWIAAMQTIYPNYSPSTSSIEYVLATIFASWLADAAALASYGSVDLFQQFGQKLVNLPQQVGTAASATVTVTTAVPGGAIAVLSEALTTAGPITQLPVYTLANAVAPGTITLVSGVNTQTFVTPGAPAGATAIPITSATPTFAFPEGSTATGELSYTLPAGTQFTLDNSWAFQTYSDVTLMSGTTTALTVFAVEPGTSYNGAGSGGGVALVSQIDWITNVALQGSASGGVDAETDTAYLNRLAATLQTMAQRPITASDYSTMALNFQPQDGTDQQEVGRAAAIDGALLTPPVERSVTLYVTDANGMALNADTMSALAAWFESQREVNFIVNVEAPTYAPIYVAVSVVAKPGFTADMVAANVQSALLDYLSPANFGTSAYESFGGTWATATVTIYRSQIAAIIQNVNGVDHMVDGTLAIGTAPNPTYADTDVPLPGTATLPTSNTATIPTSAITVS